MINPKNYLGQWVDTAKSDKDPDSIINCVSVDTNTMMAQMVSQTGKTSVISVVDLDTSGQYFKVGSPYDQPNVTEHATSVNRQSLAERAAPSAILGDLSKIGNHGRNANSTQHSEVETVRNTETITERKIEELSTQPQVLNDPVSQFIDSAIQISRKAGKKTILPIKIDLEIDFDIINVTQMAMNIGASDVEILQHIMRYINVYPYEIKKLIIAELMHAPEDAAIVEENREEKFNNILTEELEKNKEDDEPSDKEFQELV